MLLPHSYATSDSLAGKTIIKNFGVGPYSYIANNYIIVWT